MKKLVYLFSEGNAKQKKLLGGKGANLAEMTNMEIPVPPGFIISTDACKEFLETKKISKNLENQIKKAITQIEKISGKRFGDPKNPLLFSVRSGAAILCQG